MEVMDNERVKTFYCEACERSVLHLRWKSISSSLNGPEFRCDDCWKKLDEDLEEMIRNRLKA